MGMTLLIVLLLADCWTTHRLLLDGGRELNPILRSLFAEFGVVSVLSVKTLAVLSVAVLVDTSWVTYTLCGVYVLVVAHNLLQMRR